jgi:hypothetical protein
MNELRSCAHCNFWLPWRTVLLADDEPQLLGHCAVIVKGHPNVTHERPQGLTAHDFVCRAFQEAKA